MEKIFMVVMLALVMVIQVNEARALGVGDEIVAGQSYTAMPFSKFQIGGLAEFVLDKKIKPDVGTTKMKLEGTRFLLKPTICPFENVDIYAKVGVGVDKLENSNKDLKLDSEIGPAYGGGLRANLLNLEDSGFRLGFDAQYLRFDTGIDNVNLASTNYSSASGDFSVDQWQIALFMVKEFFQATIYAGGEYADSTVKYDYTTSENQTGNEKGKNDKNLGALAGLNIRVSDTVIFFAEGHFIDETSLSLGLNARF